MSPTIDCPESGCTFSTEYHGPTEEISAKVDAELHWEDEHGGLVPDRAHFGYKQCPECLDMDGFNATVSCSECGFIPEGVRA